MSSNAKIVSVDPNRKLRNLGHGIGTSFDKDALRELGLVGEDGKVDGDHWVRTIVREDGTIEVDLGIEDDQERL